MPGSHMSMFSSFLTNISFLMKAFAKHPMGIFEPNLHEYPLFAEQIVEGAKLFKKNFHQSSSFQPISFFWFIGYRNTVTWVTISAIKVKNLYSICRLKFTLRGNTRNRHSLLLLTSVSKRVMIWIVLPWQKWICRMRGSTAEKLKFTQNLQWLL